MTSDKTPPPIGPEQQGQSPDGSIEQRLDASRYPRSRRCIAFIREHQLIEFPIIFETVIADAIQEVEAHEGADPDQAFLTALVDSLEVGGQITSMQANLLRSGNEEHMLFEGHVIQRQIGAGGMGDVYLVRHAGLREDRVLKIAKDELPDIFRVRFRREPFIAKTVFKHSGRGPAIYERGESDDADYYIMEYFPDEMSLERLVEEGGQKPNVPVEREKWRIRKMVEGALHAIGKHLPGAAGRERARKASSAELGYCLTADEVLAMTESLALQLADLEEIGITHRDVKPANIMMRRRGAKAEPVLVDYGIAKVVQLSASGQNGGSHNGGAGDSADFSVSLDSSASGPLQVPNGRPANGAGSPRTGNPTREIVNPAVAANRALWADLQSKGLLTVALPQASGAVSVTGASVPSGSPGYTAPEQWEDLHNADGRSDVYALGATIYRLLTGRVVYAETTENLMKHVNMMRDHGLPPLPSSIQTLYAGHPILRIYEATRSANREKRPTPAQFLALVQGEVTDWEAGKVRWSTRRKIVTALGAVLGASVLGGAVLLALANKDTGVVGEGGDNPDNGRGKTGAKLDPEKPEIEAPWDPSVLETAFQQEGLNRINLHKDAIRLPTQNGIIFYVYGTHFDQKMKMGVFVVTGKKRGEYFATIQRRGIAFKIGDNAPAFQWLSPKGNQPGKFDEKKTHYEKGLLNFLQSVGRPMSSADMKVCDGMVTSLGIGDEEKTKQEMSHTMGLWLDQQIGMAFAVQQGVDYDDAVECKGGRCTLKNKAPSN